MRRLSSACVTVATVFAILAPSARSEEPTKPKVTLKDVKVLGNLLMEGLPLLDRLAEGEKKVVVNFPKGFAEKASLVLTIRFPDVEATAEAPSAIPGREMTASVKVDCQVHLWIDLKDIQVKFDPDYVDTVTVYLPDFRITSSFPDDAEASFTVKFGNLRNRSSNEDDAKSLRKVAYKSALNEAIKKVSGKEAAAYRQEVLKLLQATLREKQYGGIKRIHVQ